MTLPHYSPAYETWAPVVARVVMGLIFLMSAYYKLPWTESFAMQVGMSGAVGIPFPYLAVLAAFALEVIAGVALVVGWHTRTAAIALAGFVLLIALFFYRGWSDQAVFAGFMSCVVQIIALVYISVYGAQHAAMRRDPLPRN